MGKCCIVKGCINRKGQGTFYGDLCSPCYHFIIGKGDEACSSQAYRNAAEVRRQARKMPATKKPQCSFLYSGGSCSRPSGHKGVHLVFGTLAVTDTGRGLGQISMREVRFIRKHDRGLLAVRPTYKIRSNNSVISTETLIGK